MLGEPPANAASPIRHPVRASMRPPFFLLAPEGQLASEAREALSAIPELRTVEDLRALQDETGAPLEGDGEGERPAAWVLLAPEVEEGQLAALLEVAARSPKSWRIYLLEKQTGEGVRARPLSLGFPTSVDRLVEAASDEDAPPILELHQVLEAVARARHDLNNPLTAALAEVQLLRMDVPEGSEEGEALQVVQAQLERIRDLVGGLRALRAPRPEE